MVQGQVFLKGGGWRFFYLIFSRFIIFTFRNYFTLCKIVLYFEEHFFCQHNLMKKSHSKLPKNEPVCMCKEGWCVELAQEGDLCVRVGGLSEIS